MLNLLATHRILLLVGVSFIIFSYAMIFQAKNGLEEYTFAYHNVPLRYVGPENPTNEIPAIIIAHGFAGSQQLMLGYAYTFAQAGYATMLIDFTGHASNPAPIDIGTRKGVLQEDLEVAYKALMNLDHISAGKVGILGHSMGSGAILNQSVKHPERYQATIAISPSFQNIEVNDSIPPNLLIQAGAWEKPFVKNGKELLKLSGNPNDHFSELKARRMTVIPNVEHISILFNLQSHHEALNWVNSSIGHSTVQNYQDMRILWFGIHALGWLLAMMGIKPIVNQWKLKEQNVVQGISSTRLYLGLFFAPAIAVGVMHIFSTICPQIGGVGGLLVGGAFALWLFIGGIVWFGINQKISFPTKDEIVKGLIFFLLLSLSFGFMAHLVWLPYFLIPIRLLKWIGISLACMPFYLGVGYLLYEKNWIQRFLSWLAVSASLLIGTLLLISFVPGTGFLVLVAPVVPLILGIIVVGGSTFKRPWTFALGGGMYFAWQMAMIFPLS